MRILFFVLLLIAFAPAAIAAEEYICPMHPHISGQADDTCPICGMTLVSKVDKRPESNTNHKNNGSTDEAQKGIHIDPSYVQALGVKTVEVTYHIFGRNIRAFGKIAPNTRQEYAVDVRTKGWIVDLPVDAIGDTVKKGDLLFTYYSPDLMAAQSDFLIGSKIGGAEQRLRLYGMDDKAIAELKKKGKFLKGTPFYAPVNGTVTMLNVRKGSHVNDGGNIIRLQDFSQVWVNVDVPLRDIQFVRIGTPARVNMPETGEYYKTTVDFIHPAADPINRTVTVRLVLDNPDGMLKPDIYVDAVFDAESRSRLAVPEEAVLYSGMGAYVMENISDGYFKPIMVKTGITAKGLTEITSGLSKGQQVVTSGQFMLDAESNLRGGMTAMGHDHGGGANDIEQPESVMKGMDHGQH